MSGEHDRRRDDWTRLHRNTLHVRNQINPNDEMAGFEVRQILDEILEGLEGIEP